MDQRLCSASDKFKKLKRSAGSFQKAKKKKKRSAGNERFNQPAVQLKPTNVYFYTLHFYTPTLSLLESIRIVSLLAVFIKSLNGSSPMCFTAPVTSR